MAAVAGSKGRLERRLIPNDSLQIRMVDALLRGVIGADEVAQSLIDARHVREVGIDTNMICNLKCSYCYLDDRPDAKGSVPLDDLASSFEAFAAGGTKLFAFIGKEPLSDNRAPALLKSLNSVRGNDHQFRTGLVTNGTLVDRWLEALVEADISYIDISIDGLTDDANRLRGSQVASRIRSGVELVTRSPLRDRFATATVLTGASVDRYPEFVSEMFESGVVTCFASPVLRFAMSNEVADYAVSLEATWRLAEALAERHSSWGAGEQIIIDLPYRYTWDLLRSGRIPISDVREDEYEAMYWKFGGSNVFFKLNPFSYSYWRALRITHDGRAILNMDLAAHTNYGDAAPDFRTVSSDVFSRVQSVGRLFLTDFISRHLAPAGGPAFERNLAEQYERHVKVQSAA